jgi:hypothetical protein
VASVSTIDLCRDLQTKTNEEPFQSFRARSRANSELKLETKIDYKYLQKPSRNIQGTIQRTIMVYNRNPDYSRTCTLPVFNLTREGSITNHTVCTVLETASQNMIWILCGRRRRRNFEFHLITIAHVMLRVFIQGSLYHYRAVSLKGFRF